MTTELHVVVDNKDEAIVNRVHNLTEQAKALVGQHIVEFEAALIDASRLAREIAQGGDLYHPGIRELCTRLSEELKANQQNIQSLRSRK